MEIVEVVGLNVTCVCERTRRLGWEEESWVRRGGGRLCVGAGC